MTCCLTTFAAIVAYADPPFVAQPSENGKVTQRQPTLTIAKEKEERTQSQRHNKRLRKVDTNQTTKGR